MKAIARGVFLLAYLVSSVHGAGATELIVSAAASLTNAFSEVGRAFEQAHPGTAVVMNFAGSGQLLQQIDRGAPVDVFATADQETMDRAQTRRLIVPGSRADFARNALVLIAPADSPLRLVSLQALQQAAIARIAVSNPASVPVGRYSRLALQGAGLWDQLGPKLINTQHVRQSLDYVARGEVDVGFVYATDARVMPDRVKVLLVVPTEVPISYPVAVVADSRQKEMARQFVRFLRSTQAAAILQRHGFAATDPTYNRN